MSVFPFSFSPAMAGCKSQHLLISQYIMVVRDGRIRGRRADFLSYLSHTPTPAHLLATPTPPAQECVCVSMSRTSSSLCVPFWCLCRPLSGLDGGVGRYKPTKDPSFILVEIKMEAELLPCLGGWKTRCQLGANSDFMVNQINLES